MHDGDTFDLRELELSPLRDKLVAREQLIVQVLPAFYEHVGKKI